MTWAGFKRALTSAYRSVLENRTLEMAAALSYYFVLSAFPAFILLFAVVASVPLGSFSTRLLDLLWVLLPAQALPILQTVLLDVLATNHRVWLSLGTAGTIWGASSAFDAMIDALDVAYEVKEVRPFWKTRLLAIALAATTGGLLLSGLTVMILGPRFGAWLASRIYLSPHFASVWIAFHWVASISVALAAVELLYFLAPNVKQRFLATLPGAVVAVTCWIGLSYLLGFYCRHIAYFSRTYGTLAGFIVFMTWFYWNSFALLMGARLNAELAKESRKGALPQKGPSVIAETRNPAA